MQLPGTLSCLAAYISIRMTVHRRVGSCRAHACTTYPHTPFLTRTCLYTCPHTPFLAAHMSAHVSAHTCGFLLCTCLHTCPRTLLHVCAHARTYHSLPRTCLCNMSAHTIPCRQARTRPQCPPYRCRDRGKWTSNDRCRPCPNCTLRDARRHRD